MRAACPARWCWPTIRLEVIAINVLGSLNLLYAAMDTGVRTFIYCSSAAALGNFHESEPVDETYPLRPNNTYSASKAAMEMVLRGLWGKIPLDLCSLRFTVIYGPGRETTLHRRGDRRRGAGRQGRTHRADGGLALRLYRRRRPRRRAGLLMQKTASSSATSSRIRSRSRPRISRLRRQPPASRCGIEIDGSKPKAERGPLDIEPAARDFGFRAQVGHREGFAA